MDLRKWYRFCFLLSLCAFFLFWVFLFISPSDVMRWRIFSIFMPICGVGFWIGVILLIVEKLRKK